MVIQSLRQKTLKKSNYFKLYKRVHFIRNGLASFHEKSKMFILRSWKTITSILLVALIDQALKTFLIGYLKTKPGYLIELLPFLDIVYAWNYGISFGLFREYYQYSNYIFLGLNTIIIAWLCHTLRSSTTVLPRLGLILIIGGAVGNLIDRGIRGAVFDFILVHCQELEFPVFNFADSAITIGAIIFAYDYFFRKDCATGNLKKS